MDKSSVKEAVQKANQELHTKLAATYNKDEPHWRPENVAKVTETIKKLAAKAGNEKLLDLGCGTGFMIDIAKKLGFKEIHGVDITPAMTNQIDKSGPAKVTVELSDTSKTKAPADYFDLVTAYTFMSHLDELGGTLSQAFRCLKKGGIFYSDLDPNALFWEGIYSLNDKNTDQYHHFISREITHTANNDTQLEEKYGVPKEVYNLAEFQKTQTKGIREEDLIAEMSRIGFKNIVVKYNWFVGQGLMLNDSSMPVEERKAKIACVEEFLQAAMPLSKGLYKYISVTATK